MTNILSTNLPDRALSKHYEKKGSYTDCFFIDIPRKVSSEAYLEARYTTSLFKVERRILSLFVRRHSTNA